MLGDASKVNPFIECYELKMIEIVSFEEERKGAEKLTRETSRLVEQNPCVRLYKFPYVRGVIMGLSDKGLRMYNYILYTVPKEQDWIELKRKKFTEATTRTSKDYFYKAIQELKDCAILADRGKATYWINPIYFYFGDRRDLYLIQNPHQIKIIKTIRK